MNINYIKYKYNLYKNIAIKLNIYNNNNSLLNVRFGSLLGPHGLLLIYMWGENSI